MYYTSYFQWSNELVFLEFESFESSSPFQVLIILHFESLYSAPHLIPRTKFAFSVWIWWGDVRGWWNFLEYLFFLASALLRIYLGSCNENTLLSSSTLCCGNETKNVEISGVRPHRLEVRANRQLCEETPFRRFPWTSPVNFRGG